jgi:hypothetical protein
MKKLSLFVYILFFFQAIAAEYETVKDGPVHEAYATQEFATIFLQMVTQKPPEPITELEPLQNDPRTIWISGYWEWSSKHNQLLWVSGVWRRPPPGRHWVSGFWKPYKNGWVRYKGYWAEDSRSSEALIPEAPPDAIEEYIQSPTSTLTDYFWHGGYWLYNFEKQKYEWSSGRWDFFHPHWLYVPPQYLWREGGYLFVSSFWDWPLDNRGLLFSTISIAPELVDVIVYKPSQAIGQFEVITLLFPFWPSYHDLFCYEFYFHREAWSAWGVSPPWWNWSDWWTFTPSDAWWLWWWWSHSGYPNPQWITAQIAEKITPPISEVSKRMQHVIPPINVTPKGVTGTHRVLDALEKFSGTRHPILPTDLKQILQIQELAMPKKTSSKDLTPQGDKETAPLDRPLIPSPRIQGSPIPLPPSPMLTFKFYDFESFELAQLDPSYGMPPPSNPYGFPPGQDPMMQQAPAAPPSPTRMPRVRRITPDAHHPRLPMPTPEAHHPISLPTHQAQRPIPKPQGPQLNLPLYAHPSHFYANPRPQPPGSSRLPAPSTPQTQREMMARQTYIPREDLPPPQQGFLPQHGRFERPQMQVEHHDYLMSHPQPQVNPPGPRVYQVPGEYSTLPGM